MEKKYSTLVVVIFLFFRFFSIGWSEDVNGPPYFIANKGQWNKEVKFLAQTDGANIWIHDNFILLDFYQIRTKNKDNDFKFNSNLTNEQVVPAGNKYNFEEDSIVGHIIKMEFLDANRKDIEFLPLKKQNAYYNYFIGNDSSRWASFVPLYKEIIVKNIYDGIDVRYYFDGEHSVSILLFNHLETMTR